MDDPTKLPPEGWKPDYHGHMTLANGEHVPLSAEQAAEIMAAIEAAEARDVAAMPDTEAALVALSRAHHRLHRLGWSDGIYCPKDGSEFAVTEFGSTGIFRVRYSGTWPEGEIDGGDWTHPPQACLWKAIDKLTEAERATLDRCTADEAGFIDRLGASFGDDGARPAPEDSDG